MIRSFRVLSCLLVLIGAVGPVSAQAQERATAPNARLPVDPAVTAGSLPNGLRYYVRQNAEPRDRAELRLVVKAGSVLEEEEERGLAHFVEHMAFNGIRNFERQELVDYLEGIGMRFGPDLNAYTSFDETVYMLKVPTDSPQIVETAFQILEDWAWGQTFDHEEIDRERGVVIEEWRRGRGAQARMNDKQFPVLFRGSRYARRLPIGEKEVLEGFDYEDPKRFYRNWYRPDLMAVVAVGDFDPQVIEGKIRRHFSRSAGGTEAGERPEFPVPDHPETLVAVATDPEATFNSVRVFWKQDLREENTVADYRRSTIESLYNTMFNNRLFELTQQADPPFLGASSGQGRFIGAKEFYILSAGAPDNGIGRALETLLLEARRVERFGFTESELEREKRELLRRMQAAYDERAKTHSTAYASEYVRAFLWDEPIPGVEYEYELHRELLPGIELAEVNRLAREWITDESRVVLVNAPEREDVEVPSEEEVLAIFERVEEMEVEPYEDTAVDAPLVAAVPEPAEIVKETRIEEIGVEVWELANGVRVYLKATDFKDDEIVFRAWSPGGTSLVPDEEYVAASTATTVVSLGGLGQFSLVELQKQLAGKNVQVTPYISELGEGVSGRGSPGDLETLFQLIYLYFTAPRRDPDAYASFKSRIQAFLANRRADPNAAFQDTIQVTLARHHPRARPPSTELYDEMDLDGSLDFYRDRFADASDFTFVFVGALDPAEIRPLVRRYLGGLPARGREETWKDVGIRPPAGVIEKQVRKGIEPRSTTEIIFTGPFEWTRKSRHVLRSLDEVLSIRLRDVLREDLGGTYRVAASASFERDPRSEYGLRIRFGSAPARADELVDEVFAQIDSLQRSGPTAEELGKVKEIQRRSRETSIRQNGYWLSRLLFYDRYGLDPVDIVNYEELIDALTVEEIREAAKRYLRRDNYVRVSLYPESSSAQRSGNP